ncbi:hypothetical protein IOD16_37960 [Saccharothrix sp. 6-C]|uniref:hypothetical protein n=1 Tax=Saccharothrix sp. 6-C TaxID=2781735 RepID=UPI001917295B|nr:hypothetical protein [Saccharothrix sp. 6-C]QQQ76695.1 hypothetical protein IOD16_37960 [Saccharothrix sp. 6-C]
MSSPERGPQQRLRDAMALARSQALRMDGLEEGQRSADWLRFLSGSALAQPEIDEDVAVPRRLATPEGEVALSDLLPWITSRRGRVVFLRADAGEGKTTYLHLVSSALRDSAVVMSWNTNVELVMDEVLDITGPVRSTGDPSAAEPLPVVVLAELLPIMNENVTKSILATLWDHENRADDTVFVIAGRPAQVDLLSGRVGGAELCGLAPVDAVEVAALCERIQRAHDEVGKTRSATQVADLFPNLSTFLSLSPEDRAAHFAVADQPLIIGFLKAVYGPDFVQRLVAEYKELDEAADRRAYLHVCLADVSGAELPEYVLHALVPEADLDAHSRNNPWVRTDRDHHIARHAVIAQAVIEGCLDYFALERCFEDWVELTRRRADMMPLFFHVAAGTTHLKPLTTRDKRIIAKIRHRLMLVLGNDKTLQARIAAESRSSALRLLSWTRLLRGVLPEDLDEACVPLLTVVVELTESALRLATDRTVTEQIEYHRDRARRDLAVAMGVDESLDDVEDRMIRWRDFMGRDWANAQFFAELFDTSRKLALELTTKRVVERDSDAIYRAYLIGALAYVRLWATGVKSYVNSRFSESGELVNRYLHYALPERHLDVLEQAWVLSRELQSTLGQNGVLYAHALLESRDPADPGNRKRVDEAISVLEETLQHEPNTSEAIYLLADLSTKRPELIPFVRDVIGRNTSDSLVDEAILNGAAALVEQDGDARRRHLEQAVDAYAKLTWNHYLWTRLGRRWEANCSELRRLGGGSSACGRLLAKARSKHGTPRR